MLRHWARSAPATITTSSTTRRSSCRWACCCSQRCGGRRGGFPRWRSRRCRLHALSHTIDPHHGAGDWIGWLEAAGLVVTTAILAFALLSSVIAEKGGSH
jgi:hypothetical protein